MVCVAVEKGSRFLWSMKYGRQYTRAHFHQFLCDGFAAVPMVPRIRYDDTRGAFSLLALEAQVRAVGSYYLKMRPLSASPAVDELRAAAEAIQTVFESITSHASRKAG